MKRMQLNERLYTTASIEEYSRKYESGYFDECFIALV